MTEPWFDAARYAWIPGTMLGVFAGTWGSLVGVLAPKGKARGLVYGLTWAILAACAVMTVLAMVALATGQPYGVWYGLGLPGLLGLAILGANLPNVGRVYRAAEERKIVARDL